MNEEQPKKGKKKLGAAVELGGRGGKARAKSISPQRRRQIAKQGASARWAKPKK